MSKCTTQVTTSTGVFTFHDELVLKGEARRKCKEKGELLAPVTNYEDSQALLKAFDPDNCAFHRYYGFYHIGLDLYSYKNELVKVFPNEVVWNDTIHGPLYYDHTEEYYKFWGEYSKCPMALLSIKVNKGKKPLIIQTGNTICDYKRRYVCLKPASNCGSASASVKESNAASGQVSLVALGGMIGFSVAFLIGLIMYRFKKRSMAVREDEHNVAADGCKSLV